MLTLGIRDGKTDICTVVFDKDGDVKIAIAAEGEKITIDADTIEIKAKTLEISAKATIKGSLDVES